MEESAASDRLHDALAHALKSLEATEEAIATAIGRAEFVRRGVFGKRELTDEQLDQVTDVLLRHGVAISALGDELSILVDEGPSKLP